MTDLTKVKIGDTLVNEKAFEIVAEAWGMHPNSIIRDIIQAYEQAKIPAPEPVVRWFNVYDDGETGKSFKTKEDAIDRREDGAIAIFKLTIVGNEAIIEKENL